MSIDVHLINKRSGSWNEDERSYTDVYQVIAPLSTTQYTILSQGPAWGSIYADDQLARLWSKSCNEGERGTDNSGASVSRYELTCTFSTKKKDSGTNDSKHQWSWSTADETKPVYFDVSDTPQAYTNSAGEPFENDKESYQRKWTATGRIKVAPSFSVSSLKTLVWTYNNGNVTIDNVSVATAHALIKSAQLGEVQVEGSGAYRELSLVIEIMEDETWDQEKVWDVGYSELNADSKLIPILVDGVEVKKPYPLDGSGHKKDNSTDTPEQLTFKWFKSGDWSALHLA